VQITILVGTSALPSAFRGYRGSNYAKMQAESAFQEPSALCSKVCKPSYTNVANALVSTQLTHLGWVSIGIYSWITNKPDAVCFPCCPSPLATLVGMKQKPPSSSCPVHFSLGLATTCRAGIVAALVGSLRSSRNWFADYRQHRGNSDGTELDIAFPVTILWWLE